MVAVAVASVAAVVTGTVVIALHVCHGWLAGIAIIVMFGRLEQQSTSKATESRQAKKPGRTHVAVGAGTLDRVTLVVVARHLGLSDRMLL